MKRFLLPLLVLVSACGTPQEQCIQYKTRDLRTVERLIAETQANLDRGYAIETVTVTQEHWGFCQRPPIEGQPAEPPEPCLIEHEVTEQRAKAIDPEAEMRKLEGLKAKRAELAKASEAIIAECKAQYPE